ncbi:hypothetical protein [Bradyrhizobium erythrophlei]|nr:hypothetical protein [Bradyrhizobium erythrophlei]
MHDAGSVLSEMAENPTETGIRLNTDDGNHFRSNGLDPNQPGFDLDQSS